MLILKPFHTSARENATLQQPVALCYEMLCTARGPQNNANVWWPSFFNLQLCHCLWASSLCQKGADGGNTVPESRYLSCLRAVLALCEVAPCRPGWSWGSRALQSPAPALLLDLRSTTQAFFKLFMYRSGESSWKNILWERHEWGCLWHHVALLKPPELLTWNAVAYLVLIQSFLIT